MNTSQVHTLWHTVAFAMCLPVLILALAACSDEQEGTLENQTGGDQTTDTQSSVQEETNEFAENAETMFRDADQELEQIGQRIEESGDNAGAEIQDELDDLRQRRDSLHVNVDSLAMKDGKEVQEMQGKLNEKMDKYQRDLRRVRLESIESKEAFVDAARTEIQEIGEQIEQLQENLSQMDAARISEYEGMVSEFKVQREDLKTNLQDVMGSERGEFADTRVAMAEVISGLRSKVDQTFDEVKNMDRRSKTASVRPSE